MSNKAREIIGDEVMSVCSDSNADPLRLADAILAALAEAGFVLMKADAVTKHKAWCPALSQCECEGSE